jgi:elongator complex protein 1
LVAEKEKAIAMYMKAGLWKECLNIAYTIPKTEDEITKMATELAESLVEHRHFADAARLYIDYAKDDETIAKAVSALAKAYQFTEAIRIVRPSKLG